MSIEKPKDLAELITTVSMLTRSLSVHEIEEFLSDLTVQACDFKGYVVPDPKEYHRNLIIESAFAQLFILTWLPTQGSKIHDHANSNCCIRVLSGAMWERIFCLLPGALNRVLCIGENTWGPGLVTSAEIHSVANCDSETTLVTLHLYSPPLQDMKFYSEELESIRPLAA